LVVSSSRGDDLQFTINNTGLAADSMTVTGTSGAAVTILGDNSNGLSATVGGTLDLTMDEGIDISSTNAGTGLFVDPILTVNFVDNTFDPADQDTYNHATSMNIFDSLGNAHVMSLYFVKESTANHWTAYVLIDGEDVGEPNTALPAPQNTEASRASFRLFFNDDGSLNSTTSDPLQITYWNPINEQGLSSGAQNGLTFANGATFPIAEPLTSSNFEIDLSGITQFGSTFAVNDISQDGFTTGRLTNVDVSQSGIIFARYTNGQSRSLGQVALANFRNQQGLQPIGSTAWVETFSSGNPITGTPGSSALGVLQSGALEESNVDLSEELVALIEAQRNFQANSKTIQTEDAVTQSIINIR
jgi:flagellar hook protein FlgE